MRFLPAVIFVAHPLAMGYLFLTRSVLGIDLPGCFYVDAGLLFVALTLLAFAGAARGCRNDHKAEAVLATAEARWARRFVPSDGGHPHDPLHDLAVDLVRRVQSRT